MRGRSVMTTTVLAGVVALAAPAQAQYGGYPPPPPPGYDPRLDYPGDLPTTDVVFGGLRVEGRVGYDRVSIGSDDVFDGRVKDEGVGYGGEVGYDLGVGGPLLLGLYAGVDGSSVRECGEVFGEDRLCLRQRYMLSVGGRVGIRLGQQALAYAKGGYASGGVKLRYRDLAVPVNSFRYTEDLDGWQVGGGVEAAVSPRVYAKLEYVYTRLDGDDDDGFAIDADVRRQQVNAGLGVRF